MAGIHLPSGRLAPFLWVLLAGFIGRVVSQMLVSFWNIAWLPPMSEWMSGVMPYPYLLPSQMLIVAVCAKVCLDFSRGRGWFVRTRPAFGRGVLYFGYIYFAGMIARYGLQMILRPETRWFGGTIPIFFHLVLAGFVILFGLWHRARLGQLTNHSEPLSGAFRARIRGP